MSNIANKIDPLGPLSLFSNESQAEKKKRLMDPLGLMQPKTPAQQAMAPAQPGANPASTPSPAASTPNPSANKGTPDPGLSDEVKLALSIQNRRRKNRPQNTYGTTSDYSNLFGL